MRFFCARGKNALGSTPTRNASLFPRIVNRIFSIALRIWHTSSLVLRHVFATAVTVFSACALWTLCYLALLLWAILSDEGLGGPLAYPAGLLASFLVSLAVSVCLYFPATAIAAGLAKKYHRSFLWQIAICISILALLHLVVVVVIWEHLTESPVQRLSIAVAMFFLNLIPLGLYWWCVQGLLVCRKILQRISLRRLFSKTIPKPGA